MMPVIQTDPSSSFVCDYVAGINRVLSLPPYLLVDNIGRNFELWTFQSGESEPSARARYDETSFPGDPIASLLDVDIHAAFVRHQGRELIVVNHYGRARGFEVPAAGVRMQPAWERQLIGDAERVVMAGDCFIASSPRGEFVDDPARPGVFLFEPIAASLGPTTDNSARLECDHVLADWGVSTALAVSAAADRLAVAAGPRLGIFNLTQSGAGLRLGACLWETPLRFECQWLQFDATDLWTGGDGGLECFAIETAASRFAATLPDATAWGYGADPIVLAADRRELYVLGRDASLHTIDAVTGASRELYRAHEVRSDAGSASLGIGHAALRDRWLYAGFSRGGFRLLRYDLGLRRR